MVFSSLIKILGIPLTIGYQFSSLNKIPEKTCSFLFSKISIPEAKSQASELLEKVGLKSRAKFYPQQLSGGEMQRVAVARSLANDPKILLADEPTANLDRKSANVVLELFENISANGVSVIVITHDPYVSARFKNILHISDGEITEDESHK